MKPDAADFTPSRRLLLQSALGAAMGGLALQGTAQAAADESQYPKDAFAQKTQQDALQKLYGKQATLSDKVKLDAPEIAENGAVVPISVSSTLSNVTGMAILVLENPFILAAAYKIPEGAEPMVSNRLKMAKTSNVIAIVEDGGQLYSATKEVKVTVGGCGG